MFFLLENQYLKFNLASFSTQLFNKQNYLKTN